MLGPTLVGPVSQIEATVAQASSITGRPVVLARREGGGRVSRGQDGLGLVKVNTNFEGNRPGASLGVQDITD